MFEDYFLTREINNYWLEAIHKAFPVLAESTNTHCLSLQEYIISIPQKFYNRDLYSDYYQFWDTCINDNPSLIIDYFRGQYHKLNIAFDAISKVNRLSLHDDKVPSDELLAIKFINDNINYNYLTITESVFYVLILPIAIHSRTSRNAQIDKLDVWNCIEEIKNTRFTYIIDCYNHTIRNGIAHGSVTYSTTDITYTDKKGKSQLISPNQVIRLFDSLLDNCNAMVLALKCIMIRHDMFFRKNGLKIPSSYLIQELQALGNTPQWEIQDCLNSHIGDKNQLNIYVDNKLYHYESVEWLALRTAALAESFAPGYYRYFIHMQAKYGKFTTTWAGYDGNSLQKGRMSSNIKDLKGVTDGVYFYPKYRIPRFINLIHTTYLSIKNNSIAKRLQIQPSYIIRDTKIYRKENGYCINDARVYLTDSNGDIKTCIKQFYKDIVCDVIKYSKRQLGRCNIKRILPIVYIRIMVYNTDMRLRKYDSNGLQSLLVCTIGFNVSKHIQNVEIYGGTIEQVGKYRIVWNHKWLQENSTNAYQEAE